MTITVLGCRQPSNPFPRITPTGAMRPHGQSYHNQNGGCLTIGSVAKFAAPRSQCGPTMHHL